MESAILKLLLTTINHRKPLILEERPPFYILTTSTNSYAVQDFYRQNNCHMVGKREFEDEDGIRYIIYPVSHWHPESSPKPYLALIDRNIPDRILKDMVWPMLEENCYTACAI